uniref:Uncharacterized protein n=1 Tax=Oryza nivara TaxID=4536 RepID=A0A0E0HQF0_ORYNI
MAGNVWSKVPLHWSGATRRDEGMDIATNGGESILQSTVSLAADSVADEALDFRFQFLVVDWYGRGGGACAGGVGSGEAVERGRAIGTTESVLHFGEREGRGR